MGAPHSESRSIQLEELTTTHDASRVTEARELLLEYGRFVIAQPGLARFCFGTLEQEAARLPQSYLDLGGGCLVAHLDSQPVGFVAWKQVPDSIVPHAWELKRLWVRAEGRGLRLGRTLTQAVLDRATLAGCDAVYLDTLPEAFPAAHRLYLDMGFVPCPAYNDNPVEGLAYLVKRL